jgi:multisubunit Na+/H+ antiporter MnhC subunit
MKIAVFAGLIIIMTIGIYNIIYKNVLKDYQTLDLSSKNWEEE